jgi:hypothetical protein
MVVNTSIEALIVKDASLTVDVIDTNTLISTNENNQAIINTTITDDLAAISASINALIIKDASLTTDIEDVNALITTNEANTAVLIAFVNDQTTAMNTHVSNMEAVDIVEIRSDIVDLKATTVYLQNGIDTNTGSINSINTDLILLST